MSQASSSAIVPDTGGDLAVNVASLTRHFRAAHLSPRTIETYTESARQLARFLAEKGMPQDAALITRSTWRRSSPAC